MSDLATAMRNLAAQLSVGWDLEPNPDPVYIAQGQAFQEAARRILVEVDRFASEGGEG
jgi:hypothetical protein